MARLARVRRTYLIADAREGAVVPFIESEFREYAFVVKQVTTADYLICRRTKAGEAGEGAKPGEAGEAAKAGEAGEREEREEQID